MVNITYACIWLFALWKWGDWKNWRTYYPTILFFMLGDFLYLYVFSDRYPMWKYNPHPVDERWGITNTHITLCIMLIKYPATILMYLKRIPAEITKQILYTTFWILIYVVNEAIDWKLHLIQYYNGWNFWWSVVFDIVMFSILRIHLCRPLLAWALSVLFILYLWYTFDVPTTVFR